VRTRTRMRMPLKNVNERQCCRNMNRVATTDGVCRLIPSQQQPAHLFHYHPLRRLPGFDLSETFVVEIFILVVTIEHYHPIRSAFFLIRISCCQVAPPSIRETPFWTVGDCDSTNVDSRATLHSNLWPTGYNERGGGHPDGT
jgi:hypothetical protein